jgi:hypothetical protein
VVNERKRLQAEAVNAHVLSDDPENDPEVAAAFDRLTALDALDPDETSEGIERLDLRDALEMIAYPKNWPTGDRMNLSLSGWMQSVAAHALTNAGTYNYERRAKP